MLESARKPKRHSSLKLGIGILMASVAVYKLPGYLYFLALSTHYYSYVPRSFEVEKSVFVGDRIGGFLEGCGIAVFKLSDETAAKISQGRIPFLDNNSITRDLERDRRYLGWRETPFAGERGEYPVFSRVAHEDAGGNTCVDLPAPLNRDISLAIGRAGSFYSGFNENTELLIIPALRLAVFSHNR